MDLIFAGQSIAMTHRRSVAIDHDSYRHYHQRINHYAEELMDSLTFETDVDQDHRVYLSADLPVGARVRIHVELLNDDAVVDHYQPRTEIGRLALAARQAYIQAGGKLLTANEINEEVRRRRGGVFDE